MGNTAKPAQLPHATGRFTPDSDIARLAIALRGEIKAFIFDFDPFYGNFMMVF